MKPAAKPKFKNLTGARIRQARLTYQPRVSQRVLALMLTGRGFHIDQSKVCRIEKRQRTVSDIEVATIARILNVSVAELFGEK